MKRESMLQELEVAAEALTVKIVYERLGPDSSPGGLCRVKGEYRVLIDRNLPILDRISVLQGALARFPIDDIYLSPEVRKALERRAADLQTESEAEAGSE